MIRSRILPFTLGFLLVLASPTFAQENPTQPAVDRIQQIAQMPLAVDKVVHEAGADPLEVAQVARALHDGGVEPASFNRTMHDLSRARTSGVTEGLQGITGVGDFTTAKLQEGLRGEALAQALHQHLRAEFGIPAGGHEATTPPPVAQNFIPADVRERVNQRPERARSGPSDRPGRVDRPSRSPGSIGGPSGGVGGPAGGAGRP